MTSERKTQAQGRFTRRQRYNATAVLGVVLLERQHAMRFLMCQFVCGFCVLLLGLFTPASSAGQEKPAAPEAPSTFPPIKRLLPPEGIEIPEEVAKRLRNELNAAYKRYAPLKAHELSADIEVFLKAVRYALDLREFSSDKEFAKADTLLKEANERIKQLAAGKSPWTKATGLVVRGYRSKIDDSAQPYGAVIPKDFDFKQKAPLYIWLHGRGDKQTDLHFIHERMNKPGDITPPGAIVVHAFGRQCVGFLNAGEQDVLHVTFKAQEQYGTDPTKRVLIGFSMGGAGAWHVGAHYAHYFRVISPGAGFAETARYQKLKPEDYPPWYEQKLWGQNDAPAYVRNLFNSNVFAYSGELDRQIQAARVMEEAYQAEGHTLTHFIGPKTEHKYEPATKELLLKKIEELLQLPPSDPPKQVTLQTRTLAYCEQHWVEVFRLEEHWEDARVDAAVVRNSLNLKTKNVAFLKLLLPKGVRDEAGNITIMIDDQKLVKERGSADTAEVCFVLKTNGKWAFPDLTRLFELTEQRVKRRESHGPIDDAFTRRFIVVTPSGKSRNAKFQAWQEFELAHFRARWKALMRGDFLEKKDTEVNADDIDNVHLILWGDADSNAIIKRIAGDLPIKQADQQWQVGKDAYDATTHVPQLIYPNPLDKSFPPQYVVLNSGLTFREAHDRTNSLQNPKLPDWAMIDITQPPDASAPGKVVNAGFFDENWELKPEKK